MPRVETHPALPVRQSRSAVGYRSGQEPDEAEGRLAMTAQKTLPYMHATSAGPKLANDVRPSSRADASNEAAKAQVYRQWRGGMSVAVLSRQYGWSPSIINRMLNTIRVKRILDQT